ncbi:Probable E3 ubiquitin-protein ligase DTX2 [Seminavis robusta]|uniref:RING-type E3 ubiquitin transferase n=1 Tax=Seminavis robusta TaxID=568900 RepID=A0A9N8DVR7_9STRA|nr:Probable E3 ubiquitin-protein ligase DTX2 [Seminavis robusta]|eukprot:Sro392_g133460.1 Probable E3 ubiquitin-protein ligase DTX2 (1231) ;mRNA; f:55045-58845
MPGHGRDAISVASSRHASTTSGRRHSTDPERLSSSNHRTRGREGRNSQRRSTSVAAAADRESNRDAALRKRTPSTKPNHTTSSRNRESRRDREENRSRQASASRRSASRARRGKSRSKTDADSSKKRSSQPKQANTPKEKKFWGRKDAAATPLTPTRKKKAPIRRTRSYESITDSGAPRKGGNRGSWASPAAPLVDERGLPMTSIGCAPVASLRTVSPNNVETEDFDVMYARKLQDRESSSRRSNLVKRRSCSNLDDRNNLPAVEDDRKMPAKRRARSCRRKSTRETNAALVPLNPEESLQRGRRGSLRGKDPPLVPMNPEESSLRQRQILPRVNRSDCAGEAKKFAQRLQTVLEDCPVVASQNKRLLQLFASVLTDKELIELAVAMLRTQDLFRQQGKPTRVDVAYHFCRGSNVKRIQQQPGLWAKIQERGVNKSQDGDGIFTFNNPLSTPGQAGAADDVWMLVARLQGNTSPFPSSSSGRTRRKWNGETDALVRQEEGVIVLRASTQFFPLMQFRSLVLKDNNDGSGRMNGILGQVQAMHESLQILLDDVFQAGRHAVDNSPPASPDRASAPETTGAKRPASKPDQPSQEDKRTTRQGPTVEMQAPPISNPPIEAAVSSAPDQPLSFPERVKAISNPAAWDVAGEVQSVVEEHAMAAKFVDGGSSEHPFEVQSAVYLEEMAVLAENMFRTQEKFRLHQKSAYVNIGYHYCRGQNLKKMQQKPGFWSNIQSRGFSRSEDGDGIYTFNNPLGARSRGNRGFFDPRQSVGQDDDVWLLVARLQGERQPAPSNPISPNAARQWGDTVDSMVVGGLQSEGIVVLRTSIQFFPLLQFPASATNSSSGSYRDETIQELQMIHQRLQSILDRFFNDDSCATVPRINAVRLPSVQEEMLNYEAPETMDVSNSIQSSTQQIYKVLSNNKKAMNDDCSICLDSLRWTSHQQTVRLRNCGHEFHRACLHEALDHFDVCPLCNVAVTPQAPQSCLQGRQKVYHESPGATFSSSDWKAFLPYNEQGVKLLRRLQYAFLNGLIFTVESTASFAASAGQTTWSTIPHKTRSSGSTPGVDDDRGFLDPTYFDQCNLELDRCGVPDPLECERFVLSMGQEEDKEAANKSDDEESHESIFDQKPCAMLQQNELEDCTRILKGLKEHPCGWMFCKTLPQLVGKVENPLDLTMIEQRLASNEYSSVEGFRHDVVMLFDVALAHHSKENPVHFMAKQLKKQYKKAMQQGQ